MKHWNKHDELVGKKVFIYLAYAGDEEIATVIAVAKDDSGRIKVLAEDGEVLVGNQWEEVDE